MVEYFFGYSRKELEKKRNEYIRISYLALNLKFLRPHLMSVYNFSPNYTRTMLFTLCFV